MSKENDRLSSLLGDVLTVIDATVPAVEEDFIPRQSGSELTPRGAAKSLVRSMFARAQKDIAAE